MDGQVALSPALGETFGDRPGDQHRGIAVHHLQPDVVMLSGGVVLVDDKRRANRCGQRVDVVAAMLARWLGGVREDPFLVVVGFAHPG